MSDFDWYVSAIVVLRLFTVWSVYSFESCTASALISSPRFVISSLKSFRTSASCAAASCDAASSISDEIGRMTPCVENMSTTTRVPDAIGMSQLYSPGVSLPSMRISVRYFPGDGSQLSFVVVPRWQLAFPPPYTP